MRSCHLALLYKLMKYHEQNERYEVCLGLGETILRYDNAYEPAHRELMRIRYLMGDRIGALRQYERCASTLREEFCVYPSELTNFLYEQIQVDHLYQHPILTDTSTADKLLERLRQLERTVASLHTQIEQIMLESPRYGGARTPSSVTVQADIEDSVGKDSLIS